LAKDWAASSVVAALENWVGAVNVFMVRIGIHNVEVLRRIHESVAVLDLLVSLLTEALLGFQALKKKNAILHILSGDLQVRFLKKQHTIFILLFILGNWRAAVGRVVVVGGRSGSRGLLFLGLGGRVVVVGGRSGSRGLLFLGLGGRVVVVGGRSGSCNCVVGVIVQRWQTPFAEGYRDACYNSNKQHHQQWCQKKFVARWHCENLLC
jgi:hypothetical protein